MPLEAGAAASCSARPAQPAATTAAQWAVRAPASRTDRGAADSCCDVTHRASRTWRHGIVLAGDGCDSTAAYRTALNAGRDRWSGVSANGHAAGAWRGSVVLRPACTAGRNHCSSVGSMGARQQDRPWRCQRLL